MLNVGIRSIRFYGFIFAVSQMIEVVMSAGETKTLLFQCVTNCL